MHICIPSYSRMHAFITFLRDCSIMVDDIILSKLLERISSRLESIEKRHGYLSFLIEKRYANEKLLQLEVMNIISSLPRVMDYLPERQYDDEGKEKCDFWFKTEDTDYWLEIKTRPTNYRKPGHAKAITNGVNGVIEDIERLKAIKDPKARKVVMFAFYPMYDDSYRIFNRRHLPRIAEAADKEVSKPDISLRVKDAYFDIYLIEI